MLGQGAAWQSEATVRYYLDSAPGAIPFAAEQVVVGLRMLDQGRQPVARFLDVGCGNGFLSAVMLGASPRAEGVLVDFSAPMLAAARERLAKHAPTLDFVAADLATPGWRR